MDMKCTSLEEVRLRIDEIDQTMVGLLARRGELVGLAATFKKTTDDVRAPARVEQVIMKVRALAHGCGGSPAVAESVYRAMIAAFIEEELRAHRVFNSVHVEAAP